MTCRASEGIPPALAMLGDVVDEEEVFVHSPRPSPDLLRPLTRRLCKRRPCVPGEETFVVLLLHQLLIPARSPPPFLSVLYIYTHNALPEPEILMYPN